MNAAALFESSLALIERVTATVCRRGRLLGADAEDFASSVKIALVEDDYAILRKYGGRSSFEAYLAVVVQNLLTDQRTQTLGRWRPSREAERLGEADISRMLRLPQRPLYRRLESLIARLHAALDAAGLDSRDITDLIGEAHDMDFGLADWKNDSARQSDSMETQAAEEGR